MAIRKPRTVEQASALCERLAELQGGIDAINAGRARDIALVNAASDTASHDLIAERDAIAAKLAEAWPGLSAKVLPAGRKSAELGGCMIGSVTTRPSLTLAGDEAAVVEAMQALRWAKPFLRSRVTIERAGVLKALDGSRAGALADLGFGKGGGEEQFFVRPVEQGGVRG